MRVAIIGAGGHAKVVADAAAASGLEVAGFVDELAGQRREMMGLPVVPDVAELDADAFIVGIGDNRVRATRFEHYASLGLTPAVAIHPAAVLAEDVRIGAGSVVFAGAIVNVGTVIEEDAILNTGAIVDHDCRISAHSHVAPGCSLAGGVTVGAGALLGVGTNVAPSRSIGANAVCGAGSTVVRDVEAGSVVVGVPARPLERG